MYWLCQKSFLNTANYDYVLTRVPILQSMFNTARITFVLLFVILLAFINGYFLARFKFTFRNFMAFILAAFLFQSMNSVPTYIIFSALKINNNWYSTILPVVCMELTTTTFLVMGYMATVPRELKKRHILMGVRLQEHCLRLYFRCKTCFGDLWHHCILSHME